MQKCVKNREDSFADLSFPLRGVGRSPTSIGWPGRECIGRRTERLAHFDVLVVLYQDIFATLQSAQHMLCASGCQRIPGSEKSAQTYPTAERFSPLPPNPLGFASNLVEEKRPPVRETANPTLLRSPTCLFRSGVWGEAPRQSGGRGGSASVDERNALYSMSFSRFIRGTFLQRGSAYGAYDRIALLYF